MSSGNWSRGRLSEIDLKTGQIVVEWAPQSFVDSIRKTHIVCRITDTRDDELAVASSLMPDLYEIKSNYDSWSMAPNGQSYWLTGFRGGLGNHTEKRYYYNAEAGELHFIDSMEWAPMMDGEPDSRSGGWTWDSYHCSFSDRTGCYIFDTETMTLTRAEAVGDAVEVYNTQSFLFHDTASEILSCVSPDGELIAALDYDYSYKGLRAFAVDSMTFLVTCETISSWSQELTQYLLGIDFENGAIVELSDAIAGEFVLDFEFRQDNTQISE